MELIDSLLEGHHHFCPVNGGVDGDGMFYGTDDATARGRCRKIRQITQRTAREPACGAGGAEAMRLCTGKATPGRRVRVRAVQAEKFQQPLNFYGLGQCILAMPWYLRPPTCQNGIQ